MNINLNNLSDDELDGLFRQSAHEEQVNFEEEAWNKMTNKLDNASVANKTMKSKIFNKRTYSIITLLLLLSSSFFIFINSFQSNKTKIRNNDKIQNYILEADKSILEIDKEKVIDVKEKSKNIVSEKNEIKINSNKNEKSIEIITTKSEEVDQNNSINTENSKKNKSEIVKTQYAKIEKNINENKENPNKYRLPNLKNTSNEVIQNSKEEKHFSENTFKKKIALNNKNKSIIGLKNDFPSENNSSLIKEKSNENLILLNASANKIKENDGNQFVTKSNVEAKNLNEFVVLKLINNSKKIKLLDTNYDQVVIEAPNIEKPEIKIISNVLKKGFGIRIAYSPDLSRISTNAIDNIGNNFGLFLEYRFSNRFLISTGIIKAKKYYDAYPEQYKWPWGKPASPVVEVNVTCKMLDIPINIRYDFLIKPKNRLFLSSGATTYIMENEAYLYNFQNGKNRNWAGKTGRYNFSNINLSGGVEKQFSKNFSLQAEPFAKIPISKIGFGKVKLVTYGLMVSTKYQF